MSTLLQPRTVRCKATFGGKIPGQTLADTATGQIIATYRANATTFQFGFFGYADGLPMDLADVESLNLKIQPTQVPGGSVLADQTLAAEDLDLTLDAETWADGSKQHAAFAITNAEMNLDPQGARRTLWLVITALMTGGEEVTLAAGTMNLHEDNSAAADPPPENPGTAVTLEQGDARWANIADATPYDLGDLAEAVIPSLANGKVQYGTQTDDIMLNAPTGTPVNMVSELTLYITGNGDDLDLNGIYLPDGWPSPFPTPLSDGKNYIIQLRYFGWLWQMTGFVGAFSID